MVCRFFHCYDLTSKTWVSSKIMRTVVLEEIVSMKVTLVKILLHYMTQTLKDRTVVKHRYKLACSELSCFMNCYKGEECTL